MMKLRRASEVIRSGRIQMALCRREERAQVGLALYCFRPESEGGSCIECAQTIMIDEWIKV